MWGVRLGNRVQKDLNEVFVIPFLDALQELIVSSANHLGPGIHCQFIQFLLEQFPLDSVFPEGIGVSDIGRPRFFSPIQSNCSTALEGVILFQELADFPYSIFHPSLENTVDFLSRPQVSKQDAVAEVRSVLLSEMIDIFLGKKEFIIIQILKISFQNSLRHFAVEFLSAVMTLLLQATNRDGNLARVSRVWFFVSKGEHRVEKQQTRGNSDTNIFHASTRVHFDTTVAESRY